MKVCPSDQCPHFVSTSERAEYAGGDLCPGCQAVLLDVGVKVPLYKRILGPWMWFAIGGTVLIVGANVVSVFYDIATPSTVSELLVVNSTDGTFHVDAENADHQHERFIVPMGMTHSFDVEADLVLHIVDGHGNSVEDITFESPGQGVTVVNPGRSRPLCRTQHFYEVETLERGTRRPMEFPLVGAVHHFAEGTRVFERSLERVSEIGSPSAFTVSFCRE
ncbi:MAG: hypothetical protein ACI9KE_001517 [Polyangiales bacterium]